MQSVKNSAANYCYYIIINNVLGYIEEAAENVTGCLTDEKEARPFSRDNKYYVRKFLQPPPLVKQRQPQQEVKKVQPIKRFVSI
jgi:hypothetical protein